MNHAKYLGISLLLVMLCAGGCQTAARDTTGFAVVDSATVDATFLDAWQASKAVLREMELDIYTRDKRGTFVAYSKVKRRLGVLTPRRTELRITVERISSETSRVSVETMRQVYGCSLLTYPDWHDRRTTDNSVAQSFLEALQTRLS
ncbi:MAG: hypothetical protein JXR94_16425 [Candidatus Hydrogenedentes bacterium]|nr:hypothetical protein [Candidatus Hydrogenedentota bacterium]